MVREGRMVEGYSWAPPGLTGSRVEEYMRQLPGGKVGWDNHSRKDAPLWLSSVNLTNS